MGDCWVVAIGFWRPPDLGQGFSDRVRAGLQKEVPESLFWLEKHNFVFRNAIWHSPSFLLWSFRLQVAPGDVELRPSRSQEVRGSPQLQNGGLRALEEAWVTTFCLRHFSVKRRRFLCFWGVSRWLQEVTRCVPRGPWRSGESQGSRTVA